MSLSRKKPRKADLEWAKHVKLRDGGMCQNCGAERARLHAHHIAPRSRRPDLKYDLNNGITLCSNCHDWVHTHPKESQKLQLLDNSTYEKARKNL